MQGYKMFIDDERFPVDDSFTICRSSNEAINHVKANGLPIFVSFDHDLGGDDTSIIFINWLIEHILDNNLSFYERFDYYVHSQNPIGAVNIRNKIDSFIKYLRSVNA